MELGKPVRTKSGVHCESLGNGQQGCGQSENSGDRAEDYTTISARGRSASRAAPLQLGARGSSRQSCRPIRSRAEGTDPGVPACSSPPPGSPAARLRRSSSKSLHVHLPRKAKVREGEGDGWGAPWEFFRGLASL